MKSLCLNILQGDCVIANLVDITRWVEGGHAVLLDKEETDKRNNHFYYFKDSNGPDEPYIKVPKFRGTFQHFETFIKAGRGELQSDLQPQFQHYNHIDVRKEFESTVSGIDISMPQQTPWWTIERLFLLRIEEIYNQPYLNPAGRQKKQSRSYVLVKKT